MPESPKNIGDHQFDLSLVTHQVEAALWEEAHCSEEHQCPLSVVVSETKPRGRSGTTDSADRNRCRQGARNQSDVAVIASLLATLSAMATLLSVIGLYGVMAYMVSRRTREFGIRMALGAAGAKIAFGVLREAGLLVAVGLVLGFGAAWWLGRYVQEQLCGVAPADVSTIVLAAAILTTVAGAAAALPARRAARIAPMTALRGE